MGTTEIRLLIGILVFCSTPCFGQSYNQRRVAHSAQSPSPVQTRANARYSGAVYGTQQTVPPDPHFAIQAQNARERLRVEEAIARERYALLQEQYQMPFPRQLPQRGTGSFSRNPQNQYSMYRRRQDDPFGENQNAIPGAPPTQDPFGEDQPSSKNPPVPAGKTPPNLPPQQKSPPNQLPPQQQSPSQQAPPKQQPQQLPPQQLPPQQTPTQQTTPQQIPQQLPPKKSPVVPEQQQSQQTTRQPAQLPADPNEFQGSPTQNLPVQNPPTNFPTQPSPGIDRTIDPFPDPPKIEPNTNQFQAEERSVPTPGNQSAPIGEQPAPLDIPQIIPQQTPPVQQPQNPVQTPPQAIQQPIQNQVVPPAPQGDFRTPGRDRITAPEGSNAPSIDPGYPPGAVLPGDATQTPNASQQRAVPPTDPNRGNTQMDPRINPPSNSIVPPPGNMPAYPGTATNPGYVQPGMNYSQPNYSSPNQFSNQPYIHPQQGSSETAPFYRGVACTDCDQPTRRRFHQHQAQAENSCFCPSFYVGVFGGLSNLYSLGSQTDLTVLASDGGGVGFSVGQIHGCNLRSELEFTFRTNEIAGLDPAITYFGTDELDGYISSYSGMANFYWEFMRFPTQRFKPYVGGGLGFVSLDSRLETINGLNIFPDESIKDSSFAYQLMTGLNFKAKQWLDIYVEYRYFKADGFRVDAIPNWGGGEFDYESSNVFAGARFKF